MKRHQVKVTNGRKVIAIKSFDDYGDAMSFLDMMDERYGDYCAIEYYDKMRQRNNVAA